MQTGNRQPLRQKLFLQALHPPSRVAEYERQAGLLLPDKALYSIRLLVLAGGHYEDRRRGLRDEGEADRTFAQAVLSETPTSWRLKVEPVAVRGNRLALTRERFSDTADAEQPITVELIVLTEIGGAESPSYTVFFDPEDIDAAIRELDARWIASGEVAHPEVIDAGRRLNEITNRHDWDALELMCGDAAYFNHRLLGDRDAGFMSSMRMMASLVPDVWVVPAEILAFSAAGMLSCMVLNGTSTDGLAVEVPFLHINLLDGGRSRHIETFDPDKRAEAVARFEDLTRTT